MSAPVLDPHSHPVLILGAGINGCCVARELLLNSVDVVIADRGDVACGATAKSSRLIHGGLRYLEYGDVGLVRESLNERERLLRLAPQFVRPLRLFIPVRRRRGGILQAALRFLKFDRVALGRWLMRRLPPSQRGLWAVRLGLAAYDWLASAGTLPRHSLGPVNQAGSPGIDRRQFRWLCSYFDAQMLSPERFTLALLEDCRRIAAQRQLGFEVLTYHALERANAHVTLRPTARAGKAVSLTPATVVNATGAWGDATLQALHAAAAPLFGGTKGSHIITRQPALLAALGSDAVYAESADGRLVFVLPFDDAVLIGTTDIPFSGSPDQAVATPEEIAYLVGIVNEVFADVRLSDADVEAHYCGVRPLPNVHAARAGAIPRGHAIESHVADGLTIDTLIGGKLTTCRALGELAADRILRRLGRQRTATTRERAVPGGEDYPVDAQGLAARIASISRTTGFKEEQVRAVWPLAGARIAEILACCSAADRDSLPGTSLPVAFVDWVIRNEWVTRLEDLIERRLMLAWSPLLTEPLIRALAGRLSFAGLLEASAIDAAVAAARERLAVHYGRR